MEWESAREAAKSLNKEGSSITNVCIGKRNQAFGFIWKYKSSFEDVPEKIIIQNTKGTILPIKQYSLENKFIKEWRTMSEASVELGYSLGNFSTYCNGRNNHIYKGFKYYRGGIE
jgi:hypothetical protein